MSGPLRGGDFLTHTVEAKQLWTATSCLVVASSVR